MISRYTGVGFALLTLLSGGCEICKCGGGVPHNTSEPEFIKYGSQGPPVPQLTDTPEDPPIRDNLPARRRSESPIGVTVLSNPTVAPIPSPGNAFAELAGNKFEGWSMSPRINMPVGSNPQPAQNP
jgi:hypothetical protein